MPALLGGTRILDAAWLSAQGIAVRFTSSFAADRFYQLYAGRSLIGVTASPSEREIRGVLVPSIWPQPIQIVAVTPDGRTTDFGSTLPPRPYNRVKLGWTTTGWEGDVRKIDVAAGTEPDGAVDPDNVLERLLFDEDRTYALITPPLAGSGEWNFEIAGRDGTEPLGNRGDPLEASQFINAHPPDVVLQRDGSRLEVTVASQIATVEFEYAD